MMRAVRRVLVAALLAVVPASQWRYLKRALSRTRVIELGAGAGPRFVHAGVPAVALRGWWGAVRAQLQRAARPRR